MEAKLLRSATIPVAMSRPVFGHLTMTVPIGRFPIVAVLKEDGASVRRLFDGTTTISRPRP